MTDNKALYILHFFTNTLKLALYMLQFAFEDYRVVKEIQLYYLEYCKLNIVEQDDDRIVCRVIPISVR